MNPSCAQAPITTVPAANGIEYAFREVARDRRVIAFDNTGAGRSSGTTPGTIGRMALDAAVADSGTVEVMAGTPADSPRPSTRTAPSTRQKGQPP